MLARTRTDRLTDGQMEIWANIDSRLTDGQILADREQIG
jgi:hypothetical protein